MVFYGLSLNAGKLAGDLYVNFELLGIMEIGAYAMCLLLLNRVGRKRLHIICMILGGGACLSTILVNLYADKCKYVCFPSLLVEGKKPLCIIGSSGLNPSSH